MFHKSVVSFAIIVLMVFQLVAPEINKRVKRTRIRHDIRTNDSLNQIYTRPTANHQLCEMEQIEYRLTKLEVQVAEKANQIRFELQEGNRRLETVEGQSGELQSTVEGLRNEFRRFTESGGQTVIGVGDHEDILKKLELKLDYLTKGTQLIATALKIVNLDLTRIKSNISAIYSANNNFLEIHNDLVTKQFLSRSLADMKHHEQGLSERIATDLPRNCKEVQERGNNVSGIYRIQPESARPFMVLCEMSTRGGGWTFIHNRYDGSQDFYLNWHSYKHGFGNLGGEFWLGLDYIHQLTGQEINELLVELVDMDGELVYAHYSAFSVSNELNGYSLKILGGYSGDAGDSLIYHAGSRFSTKDMDQDQWPEGSCAQAHSGAWWYRGCDSSNLNGKYLNGPLSTDQLYHGMYWGEFHGAQYSLMKARMMVRPRDDESSPVFPDGIAGNGKN